MKLTPAKEEDIHVGFAYYCPGTDNKPRRVRERLFAIDMRKALGYKPGWEDHAKDETPKEHTAYLNALRGMVAQGV